MLLVQSSFAGGIADDSRTPPVLRHKIFSASKFTTVKHFDIFSKPSALVPYRSLAADTNDGSTTTGMKQYKLKDFVYPTGFARMYALGQNGAGQTKLVYKGDATTGNWTLPTSSEGNAAVQNGCLSEYKDYLWGFQGTNQVFKWGALSSVSPAITNSAATLGTTIASVANGVIAKDDNLYLPYNNFLVRVKADLSVQDAVLTIPTNYKITSICNFGLYLAIAAAPVSTFNGVSKVFLWNLTSTDVQEVIDWGEGELRVLETIEGMLVGITDRYLNNATGAGRGSLIIQTYSGGSPQVVHEEFTQALTGKSIPLSKAVKNNRLFFAAKIMTNSAGTSYNEGIWSFGRKSVGYPYVMSLDIIDENVSVSGIDSFGTAANYFFIAHSGDGSVDKTSSTATYSFTSVLETLIFNWSDQATEKKLNFIKVLCAPLTAGQTFTLKYKVDEASAWTTIGTYNTVGGLSHIFYNIESTGAAFAVGRDFQFRIESTGGLEIRGFESDASFLTPN